MSYENEVHLGLHFATVERAENMERGEARIGVDYEVVINELDTRDGEQLIYCLPKSRKRQPEDVGKFYGFNDEHGQLLMNYRKMRDR
ncbi:hypothetical protein Y032_0974g3263 [Ancylostoma ceylanicum]|uniref:Uncharacterized protein n=1 Tax=Ancylostoma ceylanicum TaxID=53326 RepID=A0A016W7I5_9BILA|nr:hypothetical protein Y032_0974g3263 [Ancylostoma ceylanicum]